MLPHIPTKSEISTWEMGKSLTDLEQQKNRYTSIFPELEFIVDFIRSGEPRSKREHSRQREMKKWRRELRIDSESCPICEVRFREFDNYIARHDSALCYWDADSLEHIISLDWGGKTHRDNFAIICSSCNYAFSKMETTLLPPRIIIHGDGRVGGMKKKGDKERKRIRTDKMIASLPLGWEEEIQRQHLFQRVILYSRHRAKSDFPTNWPSFWEFKTRSISEHNGNLTKRRPQENPTKADFAGIIDL